MKNATIHVRIDESLKSNAEDILHDLGLNLSDTVRLLLKQIILKKALPFSVNLPNKETLQAIDELEQGKGEAISLEDFKKQLR